MTVCCMEMAGTYKPAIGSAICTDCAVGTYQTTWAAISDCGACSTGYYQPETASTFCFACTWTWGSELWAATSDSIYAVSGCKCKAGQTGQFRYGSTVAAGYGEGLVQDTPARRPSYTPGGGRLASGSVSFDREESHFLYPRQKAWNIQSNGGLTMVAEVKFSGAPGMYERIVDFGNALHRYNESFLLSRWKASTRLYAAITEKVGRAI
jgi:hypothetical protein